MSPVRRPTRSSPSTSAPARSPRSRRHPRERRDLHRGAQGVRRWHARGATLPDCVVGASYTPEPVPTDVEIGKDGRLYVSTAAGASARPSRSARSIGSAPAPDTPGRSPTAACRDDGPSPSPRTATSSSPRCSATRSPRSRPAVRGAPSLRPPRRPDVELERGTVYATTGVFGGAEPRRRRRRLVPVPLRPLRPRGAPTRRPPSSRSAGRGSRAVRALSTQMS